MDRLVVGMSGASGTVYGVRLLETLREASVETHLVMSEAARRVAELETEYSPKAIEALADYSYSPHDIGAAIASGSFLTIGMVVVPCSVRSLSAIANSYDETLLVRAADVALKERRRLILVVRETPLHLGHLRLMVKATEHGAVILPPMPAFYHWPRTLEDVVDQTVGKILDQLQVRHNLFTRWGCNIRSVEHSPSAPRTDGDGAISPVLTFPSPPFHR
jgi:4-hydroxy-3-polyprenylbenzoate decarboxylase